MKEEEHIEQLTDLRLIDSGFVPPKNHKERLEQATENYMRRKEEHMNRLKGGVKVVSPVEYSNVTMGVAGITQEQMDKFWNRYKQRDPITKGPEYVDTNN